jgi:hypothetical protein
VAQGDLGVRGQEDLGAAVAADDERVDDRVLRREPPGRLGPARADDHEGEAGFDAAVEQAANVRVVVVKELVERCERWRARGEAVQGGNADRPVVGGLVALELSPGPDDPCHVRAPLFAVPRAARDR